MDPLPSVFLTKLATDYKLTEKQQEVFVARFSSNQEDWKIAESLHISESAVRNRMTGVYSKLSAKLTIEGNGPGKAQELYYFLSKEYQKFQASTNPDASKPAINIEFLVQQAREMVRADIQERCGTMRVLDMNHPIGLDDIYTHVNILETITGRRRKPIAELLQDCNAYDWERFGLGKRTEERVPGLKAVEKYSKLTILGKPGAGKTTFLKYLAIQCIEGKILGHRLPIFITLKDFAEAANQPNLLEYIAQFNRDLFLQEIFQQGKALVLLDGLDEVREEDSKRILKEIRDCSHQFRENHFIMTCRIAAREYTFEKFTEVEIADFDFTQISNFATKWFKDKSVKPEKFINSLLDNDRIQELATNPLLLTLLCLTFEETGNFPANRSELYKEGLDVLLKKWDAKRGIDRDQVYKKLSPQRKEDLLSKIALTTFEAGDYFFKQKEAERYITQYIRNLPGASTEEEALQVDSKVVLNSIEAQHGLLIERAKGIYSFSHLTFHEYFTAREIIINQQPSSNALHNLVNHLLDDIRWREVFMLAVEMSPSADNLFNLMKNKIDELNKDENIQEFLTWLNKKSLNGFTGTNRIDKLRRRACYFCFECQYQFGILLRDDYMELYELILPNIYVDFYIDYPDNYDLSIDKACKELIEFEYTQSFSPNNIIHKDLDRFCKFYPVNIEMKRELMKLKKELPNPHQTEEEFNQSWLEQRNSWIEKLRKIMIKYRDIGHNWQLDVVQIGALSEYYESNVLLLQCLNSDCYVSREVREEIEETLLLPIAEIEKRKIEKRQSQ